MSRSAREWYLLTVPEPLTPDERDAEIARLERKAEASKGMDGYAARLAAIYKRIKELRDA